MSDLFVKIEAFRLFHSDDHRSCDYVTESGATVELQLNDAPVSPLISTWGNAALYMLSLGGDDRLRIRIRPQGSDLYPVEASFRHLGDGRFERDGDDAAARAGVGMPEGFDLLGFGAPRFKLTLFRGYLSPILDVSAKVSERVRTHANTDKTGKWEIAKTDPSFDIIQKLEAPQEAHWLSSPPVDAPGTPPSYERRLVDPQSSLRIFELAGRPNVPGLVLVSLPKDLQPVLSEDDASLRLSFLMMVRPILGAYYVSDPYPYGMKYLWDAGLKYMGFLGLDPILSVYPNGTRFSGFRDHPRGDDGDDSSLQDVGLPFQIAAADKRGAAVMAMGRGASLGRFESADFVHRTLHEIYAWELRAQEIRLPPAELGPCAVCGFSSGNQLLATWLNSNAGRPFCDDVIREVYSIDAPAGTKALDQIVDASEAWAKRGTDGKAIRVYTQVPAHSKLSGFKPPQTPFPKPAFVTEQGDLRTLVCTPAEWLSAAAASLDPGWKKRWPGGYRGGDHEAHQIINSTVLVDAIRRSSFPSR